MAEKYTETYTVACYEADANQWLKPTAMLDWMQEIAGCDKPLNPTFIKRRKCYYKKI